MNAIVQTLNRAFGARMAASGRFVLIETVGRKTGRRHQTPVGFERTRRLSSVPSRFLGSIYSAVSIA